MLNYYERILKFHDENMSTEIYSHGIGGLIDTNASMYDICIYDR